MNKINPCELTPQQKQQWADTMSLMAWTCPGFRHIFYKLLTNNDGAYYAVMTKDVPTAATDGQNIMLNPEWFFGLGLKERVFVMAHEIIHNVYDDVNLLYRQKGQDKITMDDGSALKWLPETMQMAMDYRINALLTDSKIGKMPEQGCYDPQIAGANDGVRDVYKKLYREDDDQGKGGKGKGKSPGLGAMDQLLPPGASTGQSQAAAAGRRSPQQWAVEIAAAQTLEALRTQGKMPGSLQRMFNDLLNPKIPWTDYIRAIFARRVGSGSYNWRKSDRRFIVRDLYMPGRSGFGAGWIVVWGDTSGSIGAGKLNKYLGELAGIIEDVRPHRLTVLWCDSAIHRIDELEDASDLMTIKAQGVGGGGGTSVIPVFDWIAEHNETPDAFVGFTDGYVTFPNSAPSYPVVWASVADTKYPWGEKVRVE